MSVDGGIILDGVYEILNQDGDKATDIECCYQILDYLTKCLEEVK